MTLYEILGVSKSATQEEIRAAFRKLALKFHPDRNKSKDASKRFSEISAAYSTLSDTLKRADYDKSIAPKRDDMERFFKEVWRTRVYIVEESAPLGSLGAELRKLFSKWRKLLGE